MKASDAQRMRYRKAIDGHHLFREIRDRIDQQIALAAQQEKDCISVTVPREIYHSASGNRIGGFDVGVLTRDVAADLQRRGYRIGFPGPDGRGDDGRLWIGWFAQLENVLQRESSVARSSSFRQQQRSAPDDTGTSLAVLQKLIRLDRQVRENEKHGVFN